MVADIFIQPLHHEKTSYKLVFWYIIFYLKGVWKYTLKKHYSEKMYV